MERFARSRPLWDGEAADVVSEAQGVFLPNYPFRTFPSDPVLAVPSEALIIARDAPGTR